METGQIILYGVVVLIALVFIRRWFTTRSIPRYSGEDARERVRSGAAVMVDVRTAAERSRQSIPGSKHIPLHELSRRAGELEALRDKEIIFFCASGSRSLMAAARVRRLGLNVANLSGGMSRW